MLPLLATVSSNCLPLPVARCSVYRFAACLRGIVIILLLLDVLYRADIPLIIVDAISFQSLVRGMPFFTMSLRGALQASILLLATTTSAQKCFYPDGTLSSSDTPCSTEGHSSCCNADSYCMDNGLCFGGGIVSRGSCTDETWGSDACAGFCKTGEEERG